MLKRFSNLERKKVKEAVVPVLERCREYRFLELEPEFCETVEQAVRLLPAKERTLIQARYFSPDADYIKNYHVANHVMEPAVSHKTYGIIRDQAMIKLAMRLGIDCGFDIENKWISFQRSGDDAKKKKSNRSK